VPVQPQHTNPQKYICNCKKLVKLSKNTFYDIKKSKKEFDKLTFENCEFIECEIWQSQKFGEPSTDNLLAGPKFESKSCALVVFQSP
jgi:hypothetical protein